MKDDILINDRFLPFVENLLKEILEDTKYHPTGNIFKHILSALSIVRDENLLVKLGVLFHDIGKSQTPKEFCHNIQNTIKMLVKSLMK